MPEEPEVFIRQEPKVFIHLTAIVEDSDIGEGTKVWHWTHIHGAKIGKGCTIGQGCYIAPKVVVGDRCKIENGVSLFTGVVLEDDVFVGPAAVFTNVINPRAFVSRKQEYLPTLIKKGASIGANATIVCGVTVGEYAAVGAGTVVTKDVPERTLVYGDTAGYARREIDERFDLNDA